MTEEHRDEWVCCQVFNAGEGSLGRREKCLFMQPVPASVAASFFAEECLYPMDQDELSPGDIVDYYVSVEPDEDDMRFIVDVCLRPQFGVRQLYLETQQSG